MPLLFAYGIIRYEPGAIARSIAMSLANQEATLSILASGTSFREDLVIENISTAILPLPRGAHWPSG